MLLRSIPYAKEKSWDWCNNLRLGKLHWERWNKKLMNLKRPPRHELVTWFIIAPIWQIHRCNNLAYDTQLNQWVEQKKKKRRGLGPTDIQWKNGAHQTMALSFHSFGRNRFMEGSNVALHQKKNKHMNNLNCTDTVLSSYMNEKALPRRVWTYQRAAMPRMKK